MASVGSSTALNAFNIGQASQSGGTAIGQAIKGIVEQNNKLGVVQGQAAAQGASGLATAQFKSNLENQPKQIIQIDPSGRRNVLTVPGRTEIKGSPQTINIGGAVGETLRKPPGPDQSFTLENGQLIQTPSPAVTPPPGRVDPGGAIDINNIDRNRPLSAEEEAALRLQMGLPPAPRR